jgi:hypothetical protein
MRQPNLSQRVARGQVFRLTGKSSRIGLSSEESLHVPILSTPDFRDWLFMSFAISEFQTAGNSCQMDKNCESESSINPSRTPVSSFGQKENGKKQH